jgi:hypothetical protein
MLAGAAHRNGRRPVEGLPVHLPSRRARQRRQLHPDRRHHRLRQPLAQPGAHRRSADASRLPRHEIGGQPPLAPPRLRLAHPDRRLAQAGMRGQRRLDLSQLDADAAHLHLSVGAAEEEELPVGAVRREIAAAVEAAARRGRRGVRYEALGREVGAPQIAAREAAAAEEDLAVRAVRGRLQRGVE